MIIVIFPENSLAMHLTSKNGIILLPNWKSFRYKAIIAIWICLACVVHVCGAAIVKFPKHFNFFSLDFDLHLK